jgi:hypothetical protein
MSKPFRHPRCGGPRLAAWILAASLLAPVAARAQDPRVGPGAAIFNPFFNFIPDPVPPPCHVNASGFIDELTVFNRGDVEFLPSPLRNRLTEIAGRPHSVLPVQARAEANLRSRLFQYYLLDTTGFEPNVFTTIIPGVNDAAMLTVTGANCGLSTIGAVRVVLEPKPDLPTDPNDPRAFIDVFTDIDGLFVINNESGWYEGWMIHDLTVAPVAPPRDGGPASGHAQFGTLLQADADAIGGLGAHHNQTVAATFTMDGNDVAFPATSDHFPDHQTNVVPIQLSMGAFNALQQADAHGYWEFNYQTNWIHPLYELPFTGGIPGTFEAGQIGALQSIVPGPGPAGTPNDPVQFGDNPGLPRDPDKFDADVDAQREFRQRFIPSGLANEIFLDTYERLASFEPGVAFPMRLFDAYKFEVGLVDTDGDGIVSAGEGDIDSSSDGFADNARLFIPATAFKRFAVTREINDGLLAPRFAPSQRAWILTGPLKKVSPSVPASTSRDSDDR